MFCLRIEFAYLNSSSYTKYYAGLLGHLAECRIKVLFSDSQGRNDLMDFFMS